MALREFSDDNGRQWQAWDTHPASLQADQRPVREKYLQGWVTFMCGRERRRLTPVPAEWASADEALLRDWLTQADEAPPQRRLP